MNKAVIYISGTTNETVNNMIVEVLERYCEKHEYEIVALLGENSQAGMSMPMKYSFIGMAEVEDIDAVVTLSSAMVGTADKEVMETIELLAHFGITVKTAKEDMDEYYDALDCEENCGCLGRWRRVLGCIIYPSETTVIDEKGSRVVSCPTEDEAREYIREQEGSESDGN